MFVTPKWVSHEEDTEFHGTECLVTKEDDGPVSPEMRVRNPAFSV
jgi:hypothetical protein